MAQNQIAITTGVTTHENVLTSMNANFSDSETRFTDLETVTGQHDAQLTSIETVTGQHSSFITSLETKTTQQSISSSSSVLTLDASLGGNATTTLTEDVTGFSITNAATGDSGFILVEQDNSGAWTFTSTYDVLAGDLADIATITPSGSGAGSIGWYHDGTDNYLFVSNVT